MVKENSRHRTVVLFFRHIYGFFCTKKQKKVKEMQKNQGGVGKAVFVQNNEKKEDNKNMLTK